MLKKFCVVSIDWGTNATTAVHMRESMQDAQIKAAEIAISTGRMSAIYELIETATPTVKWHNKEGKPHAV